MAKNKFKWNKLSSAKRSYYIYGIILISFIIWMAFIDSHSLIIHTELNKEIRKLESEKKALEGIINNDKNTIQKLKNIDSLERFARENYGHKKENETIFIIETQ